MNAVIIKLDHWTRFFGWWVLFTWIITYSVVPIDQDQLKYYFMVVFMMKFWDNISFGIKKSNSNISYLHPFFETDEHINTIFVAQLYFPTVENLPVLSNLTGIFEEFLKWPTLTNYMSLKRILTEHRSTCTINVYKYLKSLKANTFSKSTIKTLE